MSELEGEIAYQVQLGFIQNCCMVAVSGLVFYEHATTLSQEIELIWARKKSGVTVIFALNRWFTVGLAVSMLLLVPNWDTNIACEAVNILLPVFQLLLSIIWAAFSALRVYAIGGREWRLALVTLTLGIVPIATNLASDVKTVYTSIFVPSIGTLCNDIPLLSNDANIILLVLTRSCLIASDAIILVVTWLKTYRIKREADEVNVKTSIVTLLLRDGTIYFGVLLILNVLHLVLSLTNVFLDVTYFVTSLSSIIISRFLLNLRQIGLSGHDENQRPSFVHSVVPNSHISDIRFRSTIMGNIGASLSHGMSSTVAMDIDMGNVGLDSGGESGTAQSGRSTFDEIDMVE